AIRRASTVQLDQGFEEVEARLPRPRAECAAAVLDGAAWFVGGRTEGGALCREVDVMDLGTGTWRTASAPPTPRVGASLVPLGGALVLVGGQEPDASGDLVPATSAWRYAPAEDAWSEFLAPQAFSSDVVHAFAYRGHLLLATPAAHEGAVDLLLVRPPVSRPALEVRATPPAPGDRWPSFRGGAFGRTAAEGLPTTWSDDAGVAWTTTVPGTGQSSPVVLGDRVYVTSVDGAEKEHAIVTCLDAQDGTIRWSKKL